MDAAVLPVATVIFYVGQGRSGEPALFRQAGESAPEELVEGVEQLQILYGEDTDGDGRTNRYLAADGAGLDFSRVVSLRLALLVRSPLPAAEPDTGRVYLMGGATATTALSVVAPADGRARQVFSTTIQLRNHLM
ncbi:MAG: PilW family protein [Magnetococcus sp. WYHC-3]